MTELGRAILNRRLALDWSQEDLARRANVSASYISRLERGIHPRPGMVAAQRIARALGSDSADALERGEFTTEPARSSPSTADAILTEILRQAALLATEMAAMSPEERQRYLDEKLRAAAAEPSGPRR